MDDQTKTENEELTDEEIEAESKAYVARFFEERKGKKKWSEMTEEERDDARDMWMTTLRECQEAMEGEAEKAGFYTDEDVAEWCMEERRRRWEKRQGYRK